MIVLTPLRFSSHLEIFYFTLTKFFHTITIYTTFSWWRFTPANSIFTPIGHSSTSSSTYLIQRSLLTHPFLVWKRKVHPFLVWKRIQLAVWENPILRKRSISACASVSSAYLYNSTPPWCASAKKKLPRAPRTTASSSSVKSLSGLNYLLNYFNLHQAFMP